MEEIQEFVENASEQIQQKMTELATAFHEEVDTESVVDAALEVGSFVVDVLLDD